MYLDCGEKVEARTSMIVFTKRGIPLICIKVNVYNILRSKSMDVI